MKAKIFAVMTVALVITAVVGCGAARSTLEQTSDGKMVYNNMGIGQFGAGASTLANAKIADARAYQIRKQADMMEKMMSDLRDGKTITAAKGNFLIALVNNAKRAVYIYHPEIPGLKITAEPNGDSQIFSVRDMPYEIAVYEIDGRLVRLIRPQYESDYQQKIAHKKLVGNVLVDFRIKINGS